MGADGNPEPFRSTASTSDGRTSLLRARIDDADNAPVVTLTGELDLSTVPALRGCLAPLEGRVIVDLRGVSFLDSSGIGALVAARKALSNRGGDLTLRAPSSRVRRVLELTGLGPWVIGGSP